MDRAEMPRNKIIENKDLQTKNTKTRMNDFYDAAIFNNLYISEKLHAMTLAFY